MSSFFQIVLFGALSIFFVMACESQREREIRGVLEEGQNLAKIYCSTCHIETPPELLDKKTWVFKVLPQMGPRLGMHRYKELHYESINPMLVSAQPVMTQEQWEAIVDYFYFSSPEALPPIDLEEAPAIDPDIFEARPFSDEIDPNAIFTEIKVDEEGQAVYAGEAVSSTLLKFDFQGQLVDSLDLPSAVTSVRIAPEILDLAVVGILHPNNQDEGYIAQLKHGEALGKAQINVLADSIYRPVFMEVHDYNYDGMDDYLICEYGNDLGRLSIYFQQSGGAYSQYIIENIPGSIVTRSFDFDQDGYLDIAALFAQGDERIVIYYNDGEGGFRSGFDVVARFPSVYGSMYFDLHDFNDDGKMDIIYVNGDNFDYSQILKPYHGIRILENDGSNQFEEVYYYPMYGAGRVAIADFDADGDADILAVSNFADMQKNPERGIIFLENKGRYRYDAFSFSAAAQNQWNTLDIADLDHDGDLDALIGSMNLANVEVMAEVKFGREGSTQRTSMLLLENRTY